MTDTKCKLRGWIWIVHLEFESGHSDWISVGARTPAEAKKQALKAFDDSPLDPVGFRSHPTVGCTNRDIDDVQGAYASDQLWSIAEDILEGVKST